MRDVIGHQLSRRRGGGRFVVGDGSRNSRSIIDSVSAVVTAAAAAFTITIVVTADTIIVIVVVMVLFVVMGASQSTQHRSQTQRASMTGLPSLVRQEKVR